MIVEELLSDPGGLRRYAAQPEMDPLTEEDALQEAQLLDLRFDALRSMAALLFELRLALQLREANTAVLIAYGVRELTWTAEPRPTTRTAWNVLGSTPSTQDGVFSLGLLIWPRARLRLSATSAAFVTGDVPGLDGPPPDYTSDDEATIGAGLAGWGSAFSPAHAVFLDSAPADSRP
jgi:hypothetical protein